MVWWLWLIAGLALLGVEILIPGGIIFLFFGASAIVLGVLGGVGLGGPIWFQWLLFAMLSMVSLLSFRRSIVARMKSKEVGAGQIDQIVGETVVLVTDLESGAPGKAEFRGTSWSVRSRQGESLVAGQRCIVEAVDGLTLHVRAQA